jgi:hypothetical protein
MTLQRGHLQAAQPQISGIRSLARTDLSVLLEKRPQQSLKGLRDNHHRIARAIASGLPDVTTSALCGISCARISVLKGDPAFKDLVAHYRGVITADHFEALDTVNEYLGSVRTKALAMLEDKIDATAEANEFLPTRDLVSIAELGLDRTGYGKVNKNLNVNVDFAAQLESARRRSAGARTIEASPSLSPQSGRDQNVPPQSVDHAQRSFRRV